jgi:hypothetical protein
MESIMKEYRSGAGAIGNINLKVPCTYSIKGVGVSHSNGVRINGTIVNKMVAER